jgi:protein-tyrosine phosphatase
MKIIIGDSTFFISEVGSKYNKTEPANTFVSITFTYKELSRKIYLASHHYKQEDNNSDFYQIHKIGGNINLVRLPHGDDEDVPHKTIPLFLQKAAEIDELFKKHDNVLVNCKNGRSRTGSVVAMFFIQYLNLTAEDAIHIATQALKKRGYEDGIDLKNRPHGTYGEWLRKHELEKRVMNKENIDTTQKKGGSPPPKRLRPMPGLFALRSVKKDKLKEHKGIASSEIISTLF